MSELQQCPQCGAQVELPAGLLSSLCAFCETPLVQADDQRRVPVDLVAPFDLDRVQASGRLRQRLQDSFWAPGAVRHATDPEDLKGVLVPFWVYDALARSSYDGRCGLYWYETQTYTVVVNGKTQIRTRQVRHTEWLPISGSHIHAYTDHLVSGSRGLPEAESNELEPFDVGKALPYDPALIAGQIAEHPSVGHDEAYRVAMDELAQRENAAIRAFIPGDEVSGVTNQTQAEVTRVRLVLLPVWIATYRHKGEVFRLSVNGQTGEVVGETPRSWAKIGCAVFVGLFLLLSIVGCVSLIGAIGSQL